MRIDKHVYDEILEELNDIAEMLIDDGMNATGQRLLQLRYKLKSCRKAMHASELSDEDIEAIKNAKYPEGYEHLNELMKEDE